MRIIWIISPALLVGAILLIGFNRGTENSVLANRPSPDDSPRTQLTFGRKALRNSEYRLAIEYCGKGIEDKDVSIKLSSLICTAYSYKSLEEYESAIATFKKIKELEVAQGIDTDADEQIAQIEAIR